MITDRTSTEVILRLTVHEACLIAHALGSYGDAIDARCLPLAEAMGPLRGVLSVDELDACAQSAPEPGEPYVIQTATPSDVIAEEVERE